MKNHKRLIFYIFTLLIVLTVIYSYPKKFSKEYDGVLYSLGVNSNSEKIKISFDGYLSNRLFKCDKFQGTMNIGDKKLTMIKMEFSAKDSAIIQYYDDGLGEYTVYGKMISSDIKDMFTIMVLEPTISVGNTWSTADGVVISAPANSRSEALDISNKLMKNILNNVELK